MSAFSLQYKNLTNAKKGFTAMVVCVLLASCAPELSNTCYNAPLQNHSPYLEYKSLSEVTPNTSNQFSIDFQQEFKSVGAVAVSCDNATPRAVLEPDSSYFNGSNPTNLSERLSKQSVFFSLLSGAMYAPTDDSFDSSGTLVSFPRGKYNLKVFYNSLSSAIKPYLLVKYSIPDRQSLTVNLIAVKTAGSVESLSKAQALFSKNNNEIINFVENMYKHSFSSGSSPNTKVSDLAGLKLNFNIYYLNKASFADIDSDTELNELSRYNGSDFIGGRPKPGEVNVFVITSFKNVETDVIGLAPLPGAFGMQGLAQSSVVAEYQNNGLNFAFTIAHELGHFLGLYHPRSDENNLTVSPLTNNLMVPILPANITDTTLTTQQRKVVELNPTLIPAQ